MPPVAPFLEIAVVLEDPDLQEVVISASSGLFSGQVNLYAGQNELKEFAERLRGFPSSRNDRREFTFGQNDLSGYGTASLAFYCKHSTLIDSWQNFKKRTKKLALKLFFKASSKTFKVAIWPRVRRFFVTHPALIS